VLSWSTFSGRRSVVQEDTRCYGLHCRARTIHHGDPDVADSSCCSPSLQNAVGCTCAKFHALAYRHTDTRSYRRAIGTYERFAAATKMHPTTRCTKRCEKIKVNIRMDEKSLFSTFVNLEPMQTSENWRNMRKFITLTTVRA